MDISRLGNVSSAAVNQASSGDAVAIAVLRKTLDIQAQSALQLIQALPQPASNSPSNLGNSVNTFA